MKVVGFSTFFFFALMLGAFESICQDFNNEAIQDNLINSLSSERFLSNASVKKNGTRITSKNIQNKTDWNIENYSLIVEEDSLRWVLSDQAGDSYQIEYPNDFSLFYGKDKKELQDALIEEIKEGGNKVQTETCPEAIEEIINKVDDEKYGLFKNQYFLTSDSKRVYDQEFPIESLVNTFVFPEDCHIAPLISLKVHLYGNRINELIIFPGSFSRSILTSDWKVWSKIENEKILFLFQHPFLSFQHMLFIEFSDEISGWKGDFYSFIPNSNIGDLFKDYKSKEFQLKLKVQ